MRTETIRIDLNQVSHRSITLKQGDTTTLVLEVSALGQPYQLAGLTPVLVGLRNDGYLVIQTTKITVKGNELTIKLDPKFVAIVNELNIELELYNASEEKVSSYTIRTNVAESIGKIDAPVASEDVTDNIGQAISKAVEATNALKNQTAAASELENNIETYLHDIESARTQVAQNAVKAADSESKAQKSANDAYKSQQASETAEGKIKPMHDTVVTSASQVAADKTAVETAKTQVDANASQIAAAVEHLKLIDDKANTIVGETAVAETLEITGTADAPLRELTIYGASSQISTRGVNLYDAKTMTATYANVLTIEKSTDGVWTATPLQPSGTQSSVVAVRGNNTSILPPGTYRVSVKYMRSESVVTAGMRVVNVTSAGTTIGYTSPTSAGVGAFETLSYTFTLAAEAAIRIELYLGATSSYAPTTVIQIKDIQLEAGSTTTYYEPYSGGQPSPSPEYPQMVVTDDDYTVKIADGDTQSHSAAVAVPVYGIADGKGDWSERDEISVVDGRVIYTQNHYKQIFTGAETWTAYTVTNAQGVTYGFTKGLTPQPLQDQSSIRFALCSHFSQKKRGDVVYSANEGIYLGSGSPLYIKIRQSALADDTAASFKAWVTEQYNNGTPLTLLYQLAVPITTDITDTPTGQALLKLHSYTGTTTITADAVPAVGLSAVYNCDTKSYIDKKFDELAELIHNLS